MGYLFIAVIVILILFGIKAFYVTQIAPVDDSEAPTQKTLLGKVLPPAVANALPPSLIESPNKDLEDYKKRVQQRQLTDMGIGIGIIVAFQVGKFALKRISAKIAARYGERYVLRLVSKAIIKLGEKLGSKGIAKLGMKVGLKAGEKIAEKVGAKAAIAVSEAATGVAASGPAAPLMFAFDVATIGMDILDVGGYGNMGTAEYYKLLQKSTYDTLKNAYASSTPPIPYPSIIGPLDQYLTDADTYAAQLKPYIDKITSDPTNPLMAPLMKAIAAEPGLFDDNGNANEPAFTNFMESNTDKYLDSALLMDTASIALCKDKNGIYMKDSGACSFSMADCNKSYSWPLNENDTYAEWDGTQCVVASAAIRTECEANQATYDINKRQCIIDHDYCLRKGAEWGYNSRINQNDCIISQGQDVAEMIFGTTIVRGLKQVFDAEQYMPCESGETDLTWSCSKQYCGSSVNDKHNADYEIDAGLCYPKCSTGYSGVGPLCWQSCPANYSDIGVSCSKPPAIGMGTGYVASCPPGYVNTGLTCLRPADTESWSAGRVADCPPYYTNLGDTCSRGADSYGTAPSRLPDCPSGYYNNGTSCWKDTYCDPTHSYAKWAWEGCDSGYNDYVTFCANGGQCHDAESKSYSCPSGYFLSGVRCYQNCKSGYYNNGTSCWRDPDTLDENSMTCNWDEFRSGGRCYKNCSPGYTNTGISCYRGPDTKDVNSMYCPNTNDEVDKSTGRCYPKCKAGYHKVGCCVCSPDCKDMRDDGAFCAKKTYGRGAGVVPQSNFHFKKRKIPYSTANVANNFDALSNVISGAIAKTFE